MTDCISPVTLICCQLQVIITSPLRLAKKYTQHTLYLYAKQPRPLHRLSLSTRVPQHGARVARQAVQSSVGGDGDGGHGAGESPPPLPGHDVQLFSRQGLFLLFLYLRKTI